MPLKLYRCHLPKSKTRRPSRLLKLVLPFLWHSTCAAQIKKNVNVSSMTEQDQLLLAIKLSTQDQTRAPTRSIAYIFH
jgi:hypothetical protein